MKIAISVLVNIFSTYGTTIRARRIVEILKYQYTVVFVTRANEKQKLKGLEDVKIIIVKPDKTKLWNLKLIPIIIKNKFGIVYCSNDLFGFVTYYLLSKVYKYKIIFEAHGISSEEIKELGYGKIKVKFYQFLERFVVKHADYVIALSENTFEFYERYNKRIELIPVFIDETIFNINREIETKKYQRQERKLIGMIGPFDGMFNKHILEFLYANIEKFDKRIQLIVIGKCDTKIENERITYTGYLESTQDYVNILSSLDAVLIPSKIATSGPLTKIIESMSCSLPVFTTPEGMAGLYYVEPGKDILIYEGKGIISKVNELIFDDKLMKAIGKKARIVVEKYYSKKPNEKKLTKILESINHNKGALHDQKLP